MIAVGKTVELECMDTPGHTLCHVCLRAHGAVNAIFCGDTLFNAGAGNCHHGGDPALLYATFADQLAKLPDDTKVYPGHDYIENNLRFTLAREPDNAAARALLPQVEDHDPAQAIVTTLADEKRFNTFFRLTGPGVIARLREAFPELPEHPDAKMVFLKLRELRNVWSPSPRRRPRAAPSIAPAHRPSPPTRRKEPAMLDLAAIQKLIEPIFPGLLGVRLLEATAERVVAEMAVRPELCTTESTLHGDAFMALADTVGAVGTVLNRSPSTRPSLCAASRSSTAAPSACRAG